MFKKLFSKKKKDAKDSCCNLVIEEVNQTEPSGEDEKEAQYAAGINFDLEEVEPFLKHLSTNVLDVGFSEGDINTIKAEVNTMKEDNEVKEIGIFDVTFKGKPSKIRVEAEVHIEDTDKEVVLYMYSNQELVSIIDEEMMNLDE
jgi:hypothetical protein